MGAVPAGLLRSGLLPSGMLPWGKVFLAAAIVIALAGSPPTTPALTAAPQITVDICRAAVEPCQREVNLAVGDTVGLDLFLESQAPAMRVTLSGWWPGKPTSS